MNMNQVLVVEEILKGYILNNDIVIRPSMVKWLNKSVFLVAGKYYMIGQI